MRRQTKYTTENKKRFFAVLNQYREALRTKENIVMASLQIHISLADVPNSYKRYVTHVFNNIGRE